MLKSDGAGFAVATETAYATPFRAVINTIEGANDIKKLSVIHGDDTTGIETIDAREDCDDEIYNLMGMKVTKANKDIYN